MGELDGKVALVTAAAGAGIGSAIAKALAEAGADIVVTDAHERRTFEVAEGLARETGRRVIGIPLDVTDEERVEAVLSEVIDHFGRLDILVNNAGFNRLEHVWEMSTETWQRVIDICLTGHFFLMRAALPHMIEARSGAIVNLSSIAAWIGTDEGEAHYAAAKAGVMALTRASATEVAKFGIRVNAIAPGVIWNEHLSRIYPEEFFEGMRTRTPMGRLGEPVEIADAVVFLASDRSKFISGEVLCVSGGLYYHA